MPADASCGKSKPAMTFHWINVFGGSIVAAMLIPNILFAIKHPERPSVEISRAVTVLEQIGRYGCMALMALPLFVWEFGFASPALMLVYLLGNAVLLTAYYVFWAFYFQHRTPGKALILAVLPTLIFIVSALCLRHWSLLFSAVIFGCSHIYITWRTNQRKG